MDDLSGYMIYLLLLNREAERLGIISSDDYRRYISNVIETLRQQGQIQNFARGCEKLNE